MNAAGTRLIVKRAFEAPPEMVFDAWLQPESARHWWFATPGGQMERVEIDGRPGGRFRITERRGEQVADHFGEFLEIDRPRRLVFTFATEPGETPTVVTVEIEASGDGCELTLSHEMSPEWAAYEEQARDGWTAILEGLDASIGPVFRTSREFDAPRDRVFEAFSRQEALVEWFGPKGFAITRCSLDFRPGGRFHYDLRSGGGNEMWGLFRYREIDAPSRIEYVSSFSNEEGEVTRAPFSELFPLEVLNSFTFEDLGGRTRLVLASSPLNATEEEREFFRTMTESMTAGYGGTFDRLRDYLLEEEKR